jgi:hypothetical protein
MEGARAGAGGKGWSGSRVWAVGSLPTAARTLARRGGAGGDGGEEADLVHVVFVADLDVECLVEPGLMCSECRSKVSASRVRFVEDGGVVAGAGR